MWVTPAGWGNAADGFPARWAGGGCSPRRSGDPETVQLIEGAVHPSRPHSCRGLLYSYSSLNWLTPFLQAFFMLPVPVHPAGKCHSLALPVNGGTDQQIKVSFLHWVWLSLLCRTSTLPSLQVVSSHHALGAGLHQWQLHMSSCSMAAGCPFSLGGPHAASASCKHLSMPASLCILLHLSVPPAHLGGQSEVLGQWATSRSSTPHSRNQPNLMKQGLLGTVPSLLRDQ